jgi:uncharacterized membrane protein
MSAAIIWTAVLIMHLLALAFAGAVGASHQKGDTNARDTGLIITLVLFACAFVLSVVSK